MANISEGNHLLKYFPFPNKCLRAYCSIDPAAVVSTEFPEYWYYKKTDVTLVWNDLTYAAALDITVKIQKRTTFEKDGVTFQSPWTDVTGGSYVITETGGSTSFFLDDFECSELRVTANVVDCTGGSIELYLLAKSW